MAWFLIVLLTVVVFCALGVGLVSFAREAIHGPAPRGPTDIPAWRQFAEHYHLEYHTDPPTLRGSMDGIELTITTIIRARDQERHVDVLTLIAAWLPSAPHDLLLARNRASAIEHEAVGIEEPTLETERFLVGHAEFDRHFTARGHSGEAMRWARRRGIPETLMQFPRDDGTIEVYGEALLFLKHDAIQRLPTLEMEVERVVRAARVLEGHDHPGTFCDDRHMKRWLWAETRGLEYDAIACMARGSLANRNVRVHFGVERPMTVVEAETTNNLDLRLDLPLPGKVPEAAREAIHEVTRAGDKVHFLDVVRIRRDETVPFADIDTLLGAVITAADAVENATET